MGQGKGMRDTAKQTERPQAISLRDSINTYYADRGITTQPVMVDATGLPAADVCCLLTRRQPSRELKTVQHSFRYCCLDRV